MYSADAKEKAMIAWFDYITSYKRIIDRIENGADDLYEKRDRKLEYEERLYGVLEAFGFDPEKEYEEIHSKLRSSIKPVKR
jgi:hypothetical protein